MSFNDILSQLDNAIDSNFVASLAGLSLAAIAFFTPGSDGILLAARQEKKRLEKNLERAGDKGYNGESGYQQQLENINKTIVAVSDANAGLMKAFIIFSWFLVYTITVDYIFNEKTTTEMFSSQWSMFVGIGEILFSYIFLSLAGKNLWKGVSGIKRYFNVNFNEEREQAINILNTLNKAKLKNKKCE